MAPNVHFSSTVIPLLYSTACFLSACLPAIAQQASSSWRKPNIVSHADRVSLAGAAIEEAVVFLDRTTGLFPDPGDSCGLSGTFYSQLAEFDLAINQTKYASAAQRYFLLAAENLGELAQ
ncbi:hypothetical protein B0H14DRAFT_3466303 [Mycena olivaceomarginata]|nr:hypothetical protein B0H14DRAFT_3466303 [Mycena olivaceomarginata]